jgi:hypothetical protein
MARVVLSVQTANFPESLILSNPIVRQNSVLEAVKSLLVIPITVAVVMGLGYGLAHVAERQQTATGQPDVQAAKVAADGAIDLPNQFALVDGQVVYRSGSRPMLANWRHVGDSALWHFPVGAGGHYAVELEYACGHGETADSNPSTTGAPNSAPADGESAMRLQLTGAGVSDQTLILKVANTGGSAVYKKFRVGEINLTGGGWYNLRIAEMANSKEPVMTLRGVRLIPVKQ